VDLDFGILFKAAAGRQSPHWQHVGSGWSPVSALATYLQWFKGGGCPAGAAHFPRTTISFSIDDLSESFTLNARQTVQKLFIFDFYLTLVRII